MARKSGRIGLDAADDKCVLLHRRTRSRDRAAPAGAAEDRLVGPFIKTLFKDARNVAVVALVVATEWALIHSGFGREAVPLIPVETMLGVTWLAPR